MTFHYIRGSINLSALGQQKISKISVVVDGSEESMLAADRALVMAKKKNNAELITLNVIHSQKYLYSPSYARRLVIRSTTNSILKNRTQGLHYISE